MEEWTREDTGVGAAIAAGSQAENGIWALLVQAAMTSISKRTGVRLEVMAIEKKFHDPVLRNSPIAKRKSTSPTRLLRMVSIPALLDLPL